MVLSEGFSELEKMLKELEPKVARKAGRKALRRSCKRLEKAIEAAAPVDSGATVETVATKSGKTRRGGIAMQVQIGSDDVPHVMSVEYGHYTRPAEGASKGTSFVPANSFIRGTFETEAESLLSIIEAELKQELDKLR